MQENLSIYWLCITTKFWPLDFWIRFQTPPSKNAKDFPLPSYVQSQN